MGCLNSTPENVSPAPANDMQGDASFDEGTKAKLAVPTNGEQKQSIKKVGPDLGIVEEHEVYTPAVEMEPKPKQPSIEMKSPMSSKSPYPNLERDAMYGSGTSSRPDLAPSSAKSSKSTKSRSILRMDRDTTGHSTTYCDTDDEGVVPLEQDEDSEYIPGSPSANVLSGANADFPDTNDASSPNGPPIPFHRRGTAPKKPVGKDGLGVDSPGKVHKWDSSAVASLVMGLSRPGSIFNAKQRSLFTPPPENAAGEDTGSHFKLVELPSHLKATGVTIRHDLGTGPSQVLKKLFLGTEADADNPKGLEKFGITHILSLCRTPDKSKDYQWKEWIMNDMGKSDLKKKWKELEKFIKSGMKKGKRILVHCKQGQNRSASIVVLWLMHHGNKIKKTMTLKEAYDYVISKRSIVMINKNYRHQLREFDLRLYKRMSTPDTFGTMQTLFDTDELEETTEEEDRPDLASPDLGSDPEFEEEKADERNNTDRSFDHEKKDTQRSNLSVPDNGNGSEAKPSSAEPSPRPPEQLSPPGSSGIGSASRLDTTKSCPPDIIIDEISAEEAVGRRSRVKTVPNPATEDEFAGLLGALGSIGRQPMRRQKTAAAASSRPIQQKPGLVRPKSLGTQRAVTEAPTRDSIKNWKI